MKLQEQFRALKKRFLCTATAELKKECALLAAGTPSNACRRALAFFEKTASDPFPAETVPLPDGGLGDRFVSKAMPGFTKEGFIKNQRLFRSIPFGKKGNTADHGCGWVAYYNLKLLLGDPVPPDEALRRMWCARRFSGILGADPFCLKKLLEQDGYAVELVTCSAEEERKTRKAHAFILLYLYDGKEKPAGHFVAAQYDPFYGDYLVLNGEGGRTVCSSLKEMTGRHGFYALALTATRPGLEKRPRNGLHYRMATTERYRRDLIMTEWKNLDTLKSFELLKKADRVSVKEALSGENGAARVKAYNVPMAGGLNYNYAAKAVNDETLALLSDLAKEAQLSEKYEALLSGAVINTGEKRLVLHQLTRGQQAGKVTADGVDKREFYLRQQQAIADFANKVHAGEIVNENGEPFTTAVQIGIGGSDLGPRAMYIALEERAKVEGTFKMEAKFISNVDPDDAAAVLASTDLAHALFILVSKSGTTLETLTNETFVKQALSAAGLDPAKHMIAVTSETSPLAKSADYLAAFFMDDYIGGRYSSTSAVGGAVLSLAFGPEVFARFLAGAAEEDKLALEKDPLKNPSMLDALIGVYERNVMGFGVTAVLPYSQALSRFPAHLQQLDMESNGKSVNRFGEAVNYPTGPVIFGEPGTNGQHSFYQLLHQGTDIIPLQFIGFRTTQRGTDAVIEGSTSRSKLSANVVAQIMAFACGKDHENPNKAFAGERPSSIITGDALTPEALGALLAHFENKVMFQGFLWNLNSFDQEGVQLGKVLAKRVLAHETDGALAAYAELLGI